MDSGSVVSSISLAHSFEFKGRSAGSSSGRGRAMVQHQHGTGMRPGHRQGSTGSANTANDFDDGDNNNNNSPAGVLSHSQHHYHHSHHQQQQNRRRESVDIYQQSETMSIGGATDLSADRPMTHDTARSLHFMRDASALSAHPDKSNFREKLRHWTVLEDASSPYLAPRPTTSLASQKPTGQLLMSDVEREMSFLLSRPSTSNFPAKPKELIEPLEGLLPSESPVTQKKFLVLPSIGHGLAVRRQRSNLETINQLDYSRHGMESDADFFASYYNTSSPPNGKNKSVRHTSSQHNHSKQKHHRQQNNSNSHSHHRASSPTQRPFHHTGLHKSSSRSGGINYHQYPIDPRESPSKAADTPMPLPPISHQHSRGRRAVSLDRLHPSHDHVVHLSQWEEDDNSSSASCCSRENRLEDITYDTDLEEVDEEEEEDDLERFRQKTPETYRSGSPTQPDAITPPPGFR